MSKPTLEQAIRGTVINETVIFASKAGYEHCSNGIMLKQGPQNLFRMINDPLVLTPSMDNPLEVEVVGTVTDVCIVVFAVAVAYSSDASGTTIHATMDYLRDKYGFSFKSTYGTVTPALDLTPEHIERILGKEKAKEFSEPNLEMIATPFTPNEHLVEPISAVVTEVFAFQEFDPFDKGTVRLVAKKFLEHAPVDYLDVAPYGSIELTGKPLDVCACIYVFMEMSNADGGPKSNILKHFQEKYGLNPDIIQEHSKLLRNKAIELEGTVGGKSVVHELVKQNSATEIWTFKPTDNPTEALKSVESAFAYASDVAGITVQRIGEYVIQLSGPAIKVAALLVVMSDMQKESMSGTGVLLEDIRKKYGFTSKEIISMIREIYVSRSIPGYVRSRSPEDQLALADYSLRSRSYIDRQRDDLVLRHFVQKCEGDDESKLEHVTEKHYGAFKDLFIQLRDPDVAFKEKEKIIEALRKYVTLPMLIMTMEQHFQSTDM